MARFHHSSPDVELGPRLLPEHAERLLHDGVVLHGREGARHVHQAAAGLQALEGGTGEEAM